MDAEPDLINFPPHYISKTGLEVIDVIEAFELDFKHGSLLKYVLRWKNKNGLQDLYKARAFLNMIIAQEEGKANGS